MGRCLGCRVIGRIGLLHGDGLLRGFGRIGLLHGEFGLLRGRNCNNPTRIGNHLVLEVEVREVLTE